MRILFGGSFDPIHLGHLLAIQGVLEKFPESEIIVVPTFASGDKVMMFDGVKRLSLIHKSLYSLPDRSRVRISHYDIENEIKYSYQTIKALSIDAVLVGSDCDYTKWKDYASISVPFIVMMRPGYKPRPSEMVIDIPQFYISSTEIKRRILNNLPLNNLVPQTILEDF